MKLAKLLLIEDNQEAADLVKHILEAAGYHIEHKTLGMEGVNLIQHEYFDGILLDYMLPDTEGLTLSQMFRRVAPEIPIILTSAYVNKLTPDDMLAAGVTAFVPKPLSENLLETVKKHVKTRSLVKKEQHGIFKALYKTFFGDDDDRVDNMW